MPALPLATLQVFTASICLVKERDARPLFWNLVIESRIEVLHNYSFTTTIQNSDRIKVFGDRFELLNFNLISRVLASSSLQYNRTFHYCDGFLHRKNRDGIET